MKFQSVLIVTYGRSGSTLLQGILNSIPGCLIRGENYAFCEGLYLSYKSYLRTQREQGSDPTTADVLSPWYGALHLDADQYAADMGTLVRAHLTRGVPPGTKLECVGFKEIRYLSMEKTGDPDDYAGSLSGYLDFLGKLLPGLGIVFLSREHAQVIKSAWWTSKPRDFVLSKLQQFEQAAKAYAHTHSNCRLISYEDVIQNGAAMATLFEFLGARYDQARVAEILGQRHSYNDGPAARLNAAAQPPALACSLASRVHEAPAGVRLVRLDPLPGSLAQRHKFQFGGVVVDASGGQRTLVLRDDQGNELPVTWGLPSPVAGKEMPDVVQAQNARFRCAGVPAVAGATYHLTLCDQRGGQEYRLASLSIKAGEAAGAAKAEPASSAARPVDTPAAPLAAPAVAAAVSRAAAAPKSHQRFIIWTLQRTGGTNLAQGLFDQTRGNGLHEPFNGDREFGQVNKRWVQTHKEPELKAALEKICTSGVRFKHCVEVVAPALNLALARAAQQHGYRHVFLYRRRSVDRLLSLHFAETTGVWGKRSKEKADLEAALSAPIPVEKLIAHQRRCDDSLTAVYQELVALGAKPMLVAFEDIYMSCGDEPQRQINQLLDGLSIEPPNRQEFIHNVVTGGDQGTRRNYDLFPRRDELELKCNQLPGFLPGRLPETQA